MTNEDHKDLLARIKTIEDFIGQNYKTDLDALESRINKIEDRMDKYNDAVKVYRAGLKLELCSIRHDIDWLKKYKLTSL